MTTPQSEESKKEGKRRRSRRGSSRSAKKAGQSEASEPTDAGETSARAAKPKAASTVEKAPATEGGAKRKRSRRGRGGRKKAAARASSDASAEESPGTSGTDEKGAARPEAAKKTATRSRSQGSQGKRGQAAPRRSERGDKPAPKSTAAGRSPADSSGERMMVINVAEGEECRIAIMHQGRLEELFIERASSESHVGNIYKGRITNVEPSIQAAFVDFGLPKNGFLHISDLQPQYFPDGSGRAEEVGRKTPRRDRPPIQKCLRRGQEIIVQIIKEGIGTKGPTLTTYLSIPGRYLVMMPGMNRLGVSRKIEDEDVRRQMRRALEELDLPKDMGFILRTAGLDQTKRELQRDQMYLQRLWKVVAQRIKNDRAPCELYQESDLVIRTIRDVYTSQFGRIIVDDADTAEKVKDFLALATPRSAAVVDVHGDRDPLFHKFGIEREIERINDRHVPLKSGGSLVIDSTEACVTIDVNSGRFRDIDDAEESAYRINLEAAHEIARQLRLRDLGGLIICDFIDMRFDNHRRAVERELRDDLKEHKERAKCLRTSQFGIIEMTRQRMRPSIKRSIYHDCTHCRGAGLVKNPESIALDVLRLLRLAVHHDEVETVQIRVAPEVASQLLNDRRKTLHALEEQTGRRILIQADGNVGADQHAIECLDHRGGTIRILPPPDDAPTHRERRPRRGRPPARPPATEHDGPESMFD